MSHCFPLTPFLSQTSLYSSFCIPPYYFTLQASTLIGLTIGRCPRRAMTAWPPYVFPYLTCQSVRHQPKTRAGRNKMDLSRAKTASKVIPIKRNGIERSQTKGKSTRTRSASGHETTRSRDQTRKAINVFTPLAFHSP